MAKWIGKQLITAAFAVGAALYLYGFGDLLLQPVAADPTDAQIRDSAMGAIALWPLATYGLLTLRAHPGLARSAGVFIRMVYSTACAMCALHVAIAFHLGHGWSHRAAFEHTEAASGFGPGVFVNYGFVLLWIADAVWTWVAFDRYLRRAAWVNWLVIGFTAFVMFNAGVVFAHGWMRWVNLLWFLFPLAIHVNRVRRGRPVP